MDAVAQNENNLVSRLGRPGPFDVQIGDLAVAGLSGKVYVPVAGSGGAAKSGRRGRLSVPGLAFGHDWRTDIDAYHVTLRHLASWGIAVAAPDTERGLGPNHRGFATDLESCLQILTGVKLGGGRTVVDPDRLYFAGHGMGAGAAVLAAAHRAPAGAGTPSDRKIAGVVSVYPADTTPSCYTAARHVEAPGLVLDAGRPGVVPSGNARRLAANWRGPVVYRQLLKGTPAGFSEPILRKLTLGGSGLEFGVQSLIRALTVGFIAGDGAIYTKDARESVPLRRPDTKVKGTTTATRRELFESLPELGDPVEEFQHALLNR